jgi:hypothetical protein
MSDQDGFDARLAAHFEQAHRHVPDDSFVVTTMRRVRTRRRGREVMRAGVGAAAVGAVVVASPWLIAGVARLNAALEASLEWAIGGQYGGWVLSAMAVVVMLAMRVRSR